MVFGNLGDDSGTGVAFTRDPSTGERQVLRRVPGQRAGRGRRRRHSHAAAHRGDGEAPARRVRGAAARLQDRLERHFRDMQDIEFTVERGKLYLLQTRTGKRTAAAAVRIARDMVDEGLIDAPEAVQRVDADRSSISCCIRSSIPAHGRHRSCSGLPASPGAASGRRGLRSRRRRAARRDRRSRHPRARGDDAGGLPRHGRRARDPHGARRHDEPRGGRRARHGQVRGRRLQGHSRRRGEAPFSVNGTIVVGRRLDHRSMARRGRVFVGDLPTIPSEVVRVTSGHCRSLTRPMYQSFSRLLGWADDVAPSERSRERRHAAGRADGARVRRRGHRPLSHRAHVLRGRSHHGDARDDRRARRGRTAARAGEAPADAARATSRASSRR